MDIRLFTCNLFSENSYLITTQDVCLLVDPGFYGKGEIEQLLDRLDGRVPDAILLTHSHFDHTLGVVPLQKLWPDVPVYMSPEEAVVQEHNETYCKIIGIKDADFSFRWRPVSDGDVLSFGGDVGDGQGGGSSGEQGGGGGAGQGGGSSGEQGGGGGAGQGGGSSGEQGGGGGAGQGGGKTRLDGSTEQGGDGGAGQGGDSKAEQGGGLEFKVIATPGHTPGSICWYCESHGIIFTGDTLFADSIGRTDLGHGDYDAEIKSIMEKLMVLPGSTKVYPGHGGTTTIGRERTCNPFLQPFNEPLDIPDDSELTGIEIHPDF
jgi:glyoxylase-like metal-dependent hydrolase (beta-lactamase superfamily II)